MMENPMNIRENPMNIWMITGGTPMTQETWISGVGGVGCLVPGSSFLKDNKLARPADV